MRLLLTIVIFYASVLAHSENDTIKNYIVEDSLKQILDAHSHDMLSSFNRCEEDVCIKKQSVYEFHWLPGYLVKLQSTRIHGMEMLRTCIKQYALDLLVVPEKRLYHVNGRADSFKKRNYVVIVPKIENVTFQCKFNLQEVQQICILIQKSGYDDLHAGNLKRLSDKRIIIIDTETFAFTHTPFKGLFKFLNMNIEEDAMKYLFSQMIKYINETPKEKYNWVYFKMERFFHKHKAEFTWDAATFFYQHFPRPSLP